MRFFDFFAGIGGFRLGMEMAGHECVGHCEIDKYANMSYAAMHKPKESEVFFDDIRTVDPSDMPECECYCGGFPCQSFSIAGKRGGFRDTRGTLFFEIMRLAEARKPEYLFLENVRGLLNHDGGATFETIIRTMVQLGYGVEWQVLDSQYFGVPQHRERVFIIGHLGGICRRKVFPIGTDSEAPDKLQGHGDCDRVISNTLTAGDRDSVGTYVATGRQTDRQTYLNVNGYHRGGGQHSDRRHTGTFSMENGRSSADCSTVRTAADHRQGIAVNKQRGIAKPIDKAHTLDTTCGSCPGFWTNLIIEK